MPSRSTTSWQACPCITSKTSGGALGKIVDLLRAGGTLVVVEFAWDRIDEATAEWALGRLPAATPSGKPSWLERCCRGWAREEGAGDRYHGDHSGTHFAGWAEQGFHDSGRMRAELERRFVGRLFAWAPYLYPDLDDASSEADERAAIDGGHQRHRVPLRGHPRTIEDRSEYPPECVAKGACRKPLLRYRPRAKIAP
jgi:hypothetical protein